MEDLYEILGCSVQSTVEDIKIKYRQLAKLHHPDAHPLDNNYNHHIQFVRLNNAYKILSDVNMRREFDSRYKQLLLLQELPVQDTVPLSEMDYSDSDKIYTYPCRCGDDFVASDIDVLLKFEYASCSSCSLCLRVLYQEDNILPGADLQICDQSPTNI